MVISIVHRDCRRVVQTRIIEEILAPRIADLIHELTLQFR